jgi:Flp pilus assembly CpaE family ATPase
VSKPVKILLIEDNRIEARLAQQWLTAATDPPFEVEWVDRLSSGQERLARGGIDLVLSDLDLPDSRGLDTFRKLRHQVPDVPIVLLTGQDDESVGAKAVEAGAQDYLVKQHIGTHRMASALRYALARHRAQVERLNQSRRGPARVLGFLGVKGGVGTTTVALNVAVGLARQQKSVALAELRPSFGTLALQLRQAPAAGLGGLLQLPPERIDEREVAARLCKGPAELRILFGPQKGDEFKEIEPGQAEAVVQGLSRMAEHVLLDLPCQPSAATQAAARLCQFIALVSEREPTSVLCGKVTLDLLQSWGLGGTLVGAVVVARMASATPMKVPELQTQLGCDVVGLLPPAADACLRALGSGHPLVVSEPDHLLSAGLLTLANRLAASKVAALKL